MRRGPPFIRSSHLRLIYIALSRNSGNVSKMRTSFGYVAMAVVLPALWGALSVPLVDFVVSVKRGRKR